MERVPVLKLGDILLVSIQVDLEDRSAMALQEDLAERLVATGARGVVIDISALEIVDSFIGRMLSAIASMSRLMDATTVVVGMRPAVAITLVELGLSLPGVRTALNLERGLRLIEEITGTRVGGGPGDGTDPAAGGGADLSEGTAPERGGGLAGRAAPVAER